MSKGGHKYFSKFIVNNYYMLRSVLCKRDVNCKPLMTSFIRCHAKDYSYVSINITKIQ